MTCRRYGAPKPRRKLERQTIVRLLLERVLVEVVGRHGKSARRMPLAWRQPHRRTN